MGACLSEGNENSGVAGVNGKRLTKFRCRRKGMFPVEGPQGTVRDRVVAYVVRIASDARRQESKHDVR